ncbi:MAG: hypothetical protein VKL39_05145, partial [Leptolyngbyaceae bacterium]|nr:hypothetical protein [Leptolyngbyaceae bacterium]
EAKETLEALMQGLVQQNAESTRVMEESSLSSRSIAQTISGMVMDLQFQDRNTQVTENAVAMLEACLKAPDDAEAAARTVSAIRLGEIRARYVALLQQAGLMPEHLSATPAPLSLTQNPAEDIELF